MSLVVMAEHLLIDPDGLYKFYNAYDVDEYYTFTCLPTFTSIDIDILYDILNSISTKSLQNLNMYIFKQWSLTKNILEINETTPIKRNKELHKKTFTNSKIHSVKEFDDKCKEFINGDKVVALYIINKFLKFLYPS